MNYENFMPRKPVVFIRSSSDCEKVEIILRSMEDHFMESDYCISVLCDHLPFSRSQVYRILKRGIQKDFTTLLHGFRIEQAKQLLKDSSLTIAEIAYQVGYQDPSYFSKCFKKQTGCSPTTYRVNAKIKFEAKIIRLHSKTG